MNERGESIISMLREHGCRITPQREMIVEEILAAKGHFTLQSITGKVKKRTRAVNASTVYRTLELLEEVGVVRHSHGERGAEYHRMGEGDHVHLTCFRCGGIDDLSMKEAEQLRHLVRRHRGFQPDLTHFAISGMCARCEKAAGGVVARGRRATAKR